MKRFLSLAALTLAAAMSAPAASTMKAPKGGKAISDELLGIFFEDISYAADGGLYAEMVQNGSFEYNATERDGWGPLTCWRFVRPGHSLGKLTTLMAEPLHPNNPTYVRILTERVGHYKDRDSWTGVGLENQGFDGITLKAGQGYDFSAFVRNASSGTKELRIALINPKDGAALADQQLSVSAAEWSKVSATLTPSADCKDAILRILMLTNGSLDIDYVSLLPQDTYKGHGLRKDLVEALADLKPRFMRFPGGCVVHGGGDGFWDTYRWKTTIGPRHERQHIKNCWGYHQSMGLGYYEYFQLCEDLGMAPLPILPCGVSCQGAGGGWGMPGFAQDAAPMEDMDEWTQDALDLIEWANGDPATSPWARKRAEQGHPEPFGLKYLGLGNEEYISPAFAERFKYMYERITKAHPEIVIIGTVGPGSHPGNRDYDDGWKLADELGIPIVDEHYYEPNKYFLSSRQYDNYPRGRKTKVYLGEYASKDFRLIDALSEGLYLLHVERNADVVCMTSYAPLFARRGTHNWNPDLIYFDNERPYRTCSYYVQQMFGQSAGQYYYGDCVRFEGDKAGIEQPQKDVHYGQSVVLNVESRRLFVKLCNATDEVKHASISLGRFGNLKSATKTVLTGNPDSRNHFDQQPVAPVKTPIKPKASMDEYLPPYSFTMLEIAL